MGFKNFFMNKTLLFFSILFFVSPHANAESFFDKAIKKGFSIFYGVKGDTILTCNNNQTVFLINAKSKTVFVDLNDDFNQEYNWQQVYRKYSYNGDYIPNKELRVFFEDYIEFAVPPKSEFHNIVYYRIYRDTLKYEWKLKLDNVYKFSESKCSKGDTRIGKQF